MPVTESKFSIRAVLEGGMGDDNQLWYVKTWFTKDPVRFDLSDMPAGIIIPENPRRVDQYVQEDTEIDDIVIHLFPKPAEHVINTELADDQMEAMVDRAIRLIRQDPTLGRRVIDAQVSGTVFKQPGFISSGRLYSAEIRVQIRQRVLWRIV